MSLRLSFGSRWFEIIILSNLPLGAKTYLRIECGHYSQRNIIAWCRHHDGTKFIKIGNRKIKRLN